VDDSGKAAKLPCCAPRACAFGVPAG